MRALYEAMIAVTVLTVAASCQALAGGKGGGGGGGQTGGPQSNTSLHYGKIENTYKPQKDDGTLSSAKKTGSGSKVHFNEFTIKKTSDKASPK